MNSRSLVMVMMALVVMLASGCASSSGQDMAPTRGDGGLGMYSALDATAQVYSNPMAQAPVEDNLWRYIGFVMHPFGVMLDYTVNRPFYALASSFPTVFGYTSEDALNDSRRRK
jgi:hypothetical protein